jgi:hypothetical protein
LSPEEKKYGISEWQKAAAACFFVIGFLLVIAFFSWNEYHYR